MWALRRALAVAAWLITTVGGTVGPLCCGDNFCCALTAGRKLGCWGGAGFAIPAGVFKAVSCQGKAGVAIGDDGVIAACFGSEGYGATGCEAGGAPVADASASFWGGCAIERDSRSLRSVRKHLTFFRFVPPPPQG